MLIIMFIIGAVGGFFVIGSLILNWKAFVCATLGLSILNTIKFNKRCLFNWNGKL